MTGNLGLIPIRNFGILRDKRIGQSGLYRSAQPEYGYEYEWLVHMLGLRRIISLRSESQHDKVWAPMHGIDAVCIPVDDHKTPSNKQVRQFIDLLQNQGDKPTLFHCEHGHGRTSTFSVIAKLWYGMSLEDALRHEQQAFHYRFRHPAQEHFLHEIAPDIVKLRKALV